MVLVCNRCNKKAQGLLNQQPIIEDGVEDLERQSFWNIALHYLLYFLNDEAVDSQDRELLHSANDDLPGPSRSLSDHSFGRQSADTGDVQPSRSLQSMDSTTDVRTSASQQSVEGIRFLHPSVSQKNVDSTSGSRQPSASALSSELNLQLSSSEQSFGSPEQRSRDVTSWFSVGTSSTSISTARLPSRSVLPSKMDPKLSSPSLLSSQASMSLSQTSTTTLESPSKDRRSPSQSSRSSRSPSTLGDVHSWRSTTRSNDATGSRTLTDNSSLVWSFLVFVFAISTCLANLIDSSYLE